MKKIKKTTLASVLILLSAAAFFKFALVGYGFIALTLAAAAAAVLLLTLLPKKAKIAFIALICVFAVTFAFFEINIIKDAFCVPPKDADYLIVLGCAVRGTTPSIAMRDRVCAAADYLKENPHTIAILSGGQGPGEDISEAEAMARLIEAAGIERSRCLLEEKSASTDENLRFSVDMIDGGTEGKSIVICSSEYHIYRARTMSEHFFGQRFEGLPAKSRLPVSRINYFMREGAAMMAFLFKIGEPLRKIKQLL